MNTAYYYDFVKFAIILNVQTSQIGYGYPRIFVRFADNSCLNLDLTIGAVFKMTEADWNSWFDNELETITSYDEMEKIALENNVNFKVLEEVVTEMIKNS